MSKPSQPPQPPDTSFEALAKVFGDPSRWKILMELGKGEPLPVHELARRIGLKPVATSKHMTPLRRSRVVVIGFGRLYHIHPSIRPAPGSATLDLGPCVLKLSPPA